MGYYTSFSGQIDITPALKDEHLNYLQKFCENRHMRRDPIIALTLPDPIREAAGLPLGTEAEYFVGGQGDFGQDRDASILDYNSSSYTQPSLWCSWVVYRDRIEGPDESKFYDYIEWLACLIGNFFEPWGYKLSGGIEWRGEDRDDEGMVEVEDNTISVSIAQKEYQYNSASSNDANTRVEAAIKNRAANMRGATTEKIG